MRKLGYAIILKNIKAVKYMMTDKNVPIRKKVAVILGIAYLLCPIDILPIFLMPFSGIDDIIVLIIIYIYLRKDLEKYWTGRTKEDLSRKFKKKTVIDDATYEVQSEEDE